MSFRRRPESRNAKLLDPGLRRDGGDIKGSLEFGSESKVKIPWISNN